MTSVISGLFCPGYGGIVRNLTFLFLFLVLAPLGAQQRYTDPVNHFSLEIPAGWNTGSGDGYILILTRKNVALRLGRVPGESLPSMSEKMTKRFRDAGGKLIEESNFTLGELPAHMTAWEDKTASVLSVVAATRQEAFVFVGLFTSGSNRQDVADVTNIIKTFRYLSPAPPPVTRTPQPAQPQPSRPFDQEDDLWGGFED